MRRALIVCSGGLIKKCSSMGYYLSSAVKSTMKSPVSSVKERKQLKNAVLPERREGKLPFPRLKIIEQAKKKLCCSSLYGARDESKTEVG